MSNKEFTWEDYEFLYRNYNILTVQEIAAKLQRSVSSVQSHADKLGLFKKESPTKKEQSLAIAYKRSLGTALVFLLPEYSTAMVEEMLECTK